MLKYMYMDRRKPGITPGLIGSFNTRKQENYFWGPIFL